MDKRISEYMADMARKRADSLSPERRRAIAAMGGGAGKGKKKKRTSTSRLKPT